jgi:hypothetical protein
MASDSRKPLKPRRVFRDTSAAYRRKRFRGYATMLGDCLRYLAGGAPGAREKTGPPRGKPKPFLPHAISPRFFGMNVAPSPDPAGDGVQIQALRDLGVGAVRIDYATDPAHRPLADRFLEALLAAGFPVLLHLVQDPDEASSMEETRTQAAWREFLGTTLRRYGARVEAIEIGSTPNRHSWSGYTLLDYAIAAAMGRQALDQWAAGNPSAPRPLLVGPNVSDFAPYFTIGQMAECARRGARFDAMTDNLFVDRVGEPERYDPRVAGRLLAAVHRMDLVGKQRALASIARRFGVPRVWCTYAHYTLSFGRPRIRYVTEEQYANYMVRCHLLTAAAGCFERYYWGTLVCHYKGLIDDGARVRPYPPHVHHRFATASDPRAWRRRESLFRAYRTMTAQLRDARFVRRRPAPSRARLLEFETTEGILLTGWTRDGGACTLDSMQLSGEGGRGSLVVRSDNTIA